MIGLFHVSQVPRGGALCRKAEAPLFFPSSIFFLPFGCAHISRASLGSFKGIFGHTYEQLERPLPLALIFQDFV